MRALFVASLLVCAACSRGDLHSGSLPESSDFLPMIGDTVAAQSAIAEQDSVAPDSSQEPRLVLRCEQGRVKAYVVAGAAALLESSDSANQVVPVLLDSTPSC